MPWWGWIIVGAVLLGAETVVPADFYLVFLGLSALAVGLLGLAGLDGPVWLQWAIFAFLSVGSLVAFRSRVRDRFFVRGSDPRADDTLVGEVGVVQELLAPGSVGRVELRGSLWSGRNGEEARLEPGTRVRVERVDGLLLHVRRESPPPG
jgi:membrane protein implicated in regulation of membrane protease activity